MSVYVIAEINVKDRAGYDREFQPLAREMLKAAGAEFVVGDDNPKGLLGKTTNRIVIAKFRNMAVVDNWYDGFKNLVSTVGEKYADFRMFAAEDAKTA